MLVGLAALCAMLALPAFASATPAHLDKVPEGSFTAHGGHLQLSRASGEIYTGATTTGVGTFESTTTGRIQLTFHAVKNSIGVNCQTAGQPTGTILTTELTFHLVMLATNVPGILITGGPTPGEPGWGHHFADYNCGIFFPTVQWKGNGILGTITAPECGRRSSTATVSLEAIEAGVQKHTVYTGVNYRLESSISGGAYSQQAIATHATITFPGGERELICTH